MKKTLATIVSALAFVGAAYSQGNIRWDTIPFNAMTAQTNAVSYSPLFGGGAAGGTQGVTASAGGGFYYALLYTAYSGSLAAQPGSLGSLSSWQETGATATNSTAVAGRLTPIGANAGFAVPWSPGVTNSIMLVGWSSNLGTTWTTALATLQSASALGNVVGNAFFGMSATGYITTLSTSTSPGSTVFGTAATAQGLPINSLLTPLYLVPVPEPSTLVLAGLGGLSLLAFRRKK